MKVITIHSEARLIETFTSITAVIPEDLILVHLVCIIGVKWGVHCKAAINLHRSKSLLSIAASLAF